MRIAPDAKVEKWLDAQVADELWLNSIVIAELMFGAARLPEGAKKRQLLKAIQGTVEEDYAGRILSFDLEAAAAMPKLRHAARQKVAPSTWQMRRSPLFAGYKMPSWRLETPSILRV